MKEELSHTIEIKDDRFDQSSEQEDDYFYGEDLAKRLSDLLNLTDINSENYLEDYGWCISSKLKDGDFIEFIIYPGFLFHEDEADLWRIRVIYTSSTKGYIFTKKSQAVLPENLRGDLERLFEQNFTEVVAFEEGMVWV